MGRDRDMPSYSHENGLHTMTSTLRTETFSSSSGSSQVVLNVIPLPVPYAYAYAYAPQGERGEVRSSEEELPSLGSSPLEEV